MSTFPLLIRRIETAYGELGHQLGWRFLYSPRATFASETKLAFIGLNPGGDVYHPPAPSVEGGNAYRLESWGDAGGLNGLQVQVGRLFERLAEAIGHSSADRLMDETLTANFCPFRSPSWDKLPNRPASVRFSEDLWGDILKTVSPSVVICLGPRPADYIGATLITNGARRVGPSQNGPVGWGSVTYKMDRFDSSSGPTLVVRLPHLSRFAIVGRSESQRALNQIMSAVSASF